jgi:predicted RNA methylase
VRAGRTETLDRSAGQVVSPVACDRRAHTTECDTAIANPRLGREAAVPHPPARPYVAAKREVSAEVNLALTSSVCVEAHKQRRRIFVAADASHQGQCSSVAEQTGAVP